ncbi:outer membrane beta-barrel protein [Maribacter sp. 2307ULW6-5]|uniref:outer membrane beta-barrel protein n=1 Tax=Maribacter sp. 2307ULW6-5 TaxID=3386275 RepID=UPI0039BC973B
MKNGILYLLFGLCVSTAMGQSLPKFGLSGGLLNTNADINVSALGFNLANIDAVNKTGFYVGVAADIAATDALHIQPELLYGSAGDLGFVYLPVMLKYFLGDNFFLQAGPQLNFSTNLNDIKRAIRDIQGVVGGNGDVDDVLRSTAVDLAVGLGYKVTSNISLQGRYAFALSDRYNGPLGGSLNVRNATLQLGVLYFF